MNWRVAKCIPALVNQIDRKWPERRKDSDGTIGDASHSSHYSDHNPNPDGVVCAVDITHDPASGCDSYRLAQALIDSRDPRIKYIISNRRIASGQGGPHPWEWRPYHGASPHDHHVHISIVGDPSLYDSTALWRWRFDIAGENLPPKDVLYVAPLPTLRFGMRSDLVKVLQHELQIEADGFFGHLTQQALEMFQAVHGLKADGVCGPLTWKAFN